MDRMPPERAILVHLAVNARQKLEAEDSVAELGGLVRAAGAEVAEKVFQVRPKVSPRTFIGEGKVEEIKRLAHELDAGLVVFDDNLSPTQLRSLEKDLKLKVLDRTQLILDIFAQRARSNEGKMQVELAQLSYLLPRLVGKGRELSRLGGGIGTRGPGEKKLEIDRRRIQDRIARIKREIKGVSKRRAGQRRSRRESLIPLVSLVGYTSVGKSTLFNRLAQAATLTSPQLFATLDPLVRRASFPDGLSYFLSDTVGFIRKLPVELVSAFKATLEEVVESDLILHVIDLSAPGGSLEPVAPAFRAPGGSLEPVAPAFRAPGADRQREAVDRILEEIGAADIPRLPVYNKIDRLPDREDFLRRNAGPGSEGMYVSAATGEGVPALRDRLRSLLFRGLQLFYVRIPRSRADVLEAFPKWTIVLKRRESGEFFEMQVMADPEQMLPYLPYLERGGTSW